jgi:hypothetical protein
MPGLGVSRAAMFAEPTITEIEKVIGLVHGGESCRGRCPSPGLDRERAATSGLPFFSFALGKLPV